ncbi:MAG: phosphatidate cytidylyltransferase [Acidobacteria bacterium]|nr:phosphatidate cytidylyltransferase [Acidobacteriota bacterium]
MKSRLITAAVALPVLIASIVVPQLWWLFVLLGMAAVVIALYEFWFLCRRVGAKPDVVVGYAAVAGLFVVFFFNWIEYLYVVVPLFIVGALAAEMLRGAPFDKMVLSVGSTVLGVFYVAFLGAHLIGVRTGFTNLFVQPETYWVTNPYVSHTLSTHMLSYFFLVLMGSDTGAYFAGRALGRHKLAPKVSPGKTWEGAVGGMVASLLAAALSHYWFFPEVSLPVLLGLAALMNVLGVVGDLTESALKRGANAKDAAQILPGHGGLFDRLDSLLFNAPLLYYFALFYWR